MLCPRGLSKVLQALKLQRYSVFLNVSLLLYTLFIRIIAEKLQIVPHNVFILVGEKLVERKRNVE